jgi:alpha-N-arabinofuranosidase
MLSFDEWNVWYRTRRNRAARTKAGWPEAPPILEEVYTMEDALAFGGACISLLNHADRVKAGCLAQLVNAIAPILTETGGPAWRQTIFWPFAQWSNHGRGKVLKALSDSPSYDANYYDPRGKDDNYIPVTAAYLKLGAVHQEDGGVTIFALNRHLEDKMPVDIAMPGFGKLAVVEAVQLSNPDLKAVNTKDDPNRVTPRKLAGVKAGDARVTATLPPASWSMIRLRA